MGLLGSLLGKNETGIIIDLAGISADSVHVTLCYLSELFQNNSIVCVTNNRDLLDLNCRNLFYGIRMVRITDPKNLPITSEPQLPIKALIKGVNLIDKDYFIQFASKGIFDWIKKPVIFTDDVNMVKSSLQWSLIEKTSADQAAIYLYTITVAYNHAIEGISPSKNDLFQELSQISASFADFYIHIQRSQKFLGQNLEPPQDDIGQCIHYILTYSNYK
jgi:hypothetical protein